MAIDHPPSSGKPNRQPNITPAKIRVGRINAHHVARRVEPDVAVISTLSPGAKCGYGTSITPALIISLNRQGIDTYTFYCSFVGYVFFLHGYCGDKGNDFPLFQQM